MATVTIYAGAGDGYIESKSNTWTVAQAGTGTLSVTTGTQQKSEFGIERNKDIEELFFPFDTSALAGNSVASVALTLYAFWYSGPTSGYLEARAAGDLGASLEAGEWITAANWGGKVLCAREAVSALPTGLSAVAVELDSQAGFPGSINTGGTTWIAVGFDAIVGSAWPTTDYRLSVKLADETGTTEDPKLFLEYQPAGNALFCGAQF